MPFITVGAESFGNGKFVNIPVGEKLKASVYDIEKTQVANGDNKGKDQFVVTYKITEDGEWKGREIRYNNVALYEGKSAWVLVTFAGAVGWETDKEKGVDVPDNFKSVLGTELIIKIGERQSNKTDDDGKPILYNTATPVGKVPTGGGEQKPAAKKASWSDV